MAQNYKCVSGGLPEPVRGNATGWLLFKNFNEKEKAFVSEELAIDNIGKEQYARVPLTARHNSVIFAAGPRSFPEMMHETVTGFSARTLRDSRQPRSAPAGGGLPYPLH